MSIGELGRYRPSFLSTEAMRTTAQSLRLTVARAAHKIPTPSRIAGDLARSILVNPHPSPPTPGETIFIQRDTAQPALTTTEPLYTHPPLPEVRAQEIEDAEILWIRDGKSPPPETGFIKDNTFVPNRNIRIIQPPTL